MAHRIRPHLWWIVGLLLVGVGIVVYEMPGANDVTFGYAGYGTGSGQTVYTFAHGAMLLSRTRLICALVVTAGLLVLAARVGYLLGARTARAPATGQPPRGQ